MDTGSPAPSIGNGAGGTPRVCSCIIQVTSDMMFSECVYYSQKK